MSNEDKMREEFERRFRYECYRQTDFGNYQHEETQQRWVGWKACAAIKDAEIADLQRSVKELRDVLDSANTALYYGECSINERNPKLDSKNERIARMMERMQDRIREALAKSEHHNSRALEKMLLEARIQELEKAIESDYTVGLRDVIANLRDKFDELNKE